MSRVCDVCGKGPMSGSRIVRHGLEKAKGGIGLHTTGISKRRFLPNLQNRKFWVESENRWVSLRITNAALRTIDKNGIDAVLADLRAAGEKI